MVISSSEQARVKRSRKLARRYAWHVTKRGRQSAEKTFTVEKTSTVGRTFVTTYTTREGYLPRRYPGEHIRSVRLREGYLLIRYQGDRDRLPSTARREKLALDLHQREHIEVGC
jgi:hypothetical protein